MKSTPRSMVQNVRGMVGALLGARVARLGFFAFVAFAAATLSPACTDSTGPGPGDDTTAPPGLDVTQPYPIDRGDDLDTPGSYKGLWLRLVDTG